MPSTVWSALLGSARLKLGSARPGPAHLNYVECCPALSGLLFKDKLAVAGQPASQRNNNKRTLDKNGSMSSLSGLWRLLRAKLDGGAQQ